MVEIAKCQVIENRLFNAKVLFNLEIGHDTVPLQIEMGPWHFCVFIEVEFHNSFRLSCSAGFWNQYVLNGRWLGLIIGQWV